MHGHSTHLRRRDVRLLEEIRKRVRDVQDAVNAQRLSSEVVQEYLSSLEEDSRPLLALQDRLHRYRQIDLAQQALFRGARRSRRYGRRPARFSSHREPLPVIKPEVALAVLGSWQVLALGRAEHARRATENLVRRAEALRARGRLLIARSQQLLAQS